MEKSHDGELLEVLVRRIDIVNVLSIQLLDIFNEYQASSDKDRLKELDNERKQIIYSIANLTTI